MKPLSAEFGWSRGAIALGMTWITLGVVVRYMLHATRIRRSAQLTARLPTTD